MTFRVPEIVLQDDESKKDLHLLGSEEAARACMLSVTEPEVSWRGGSLIGIVSSPVLSFQ